MKAGIFDGTIHEKLLRHVRFVRVHIDEPPRSQYRCGKQNGELSFLGHIGIPRFGEGVQEGEAGEAVYFF